MKNSIVLQIPREKITFLVKIIEGYENLGVVSTIDSSKGMVIVRVTPDTESDVRKILNELDFVEKIVN